jgi:hypothetical protein
MKRIIKYSFLLVGLIAAMDMASCVKDRNSLATDFSGIQPIMELRTPSKNVAGLTNFTASTLAFSGDPDTISFYVNLASVNALNKDVTITMQADNAAMNSVNSGLAPASQYSFFPDSTFSWTQKTAVVKAGQHVALVSVVFYPGKIDPTQNYMLPISIKDAQGVNISSNFGTIYYHVIGNPLAGAYIQDFKRWNSLADTTTPTAGGTFYGQLVNIPPINGTTLLTPEGYLVANFGGSAGVDLSFDNNAGVLSNFQVAVDPATQAALDANSFTLSVAPKLVTANIVGNASTKYKGSTFRYYMVIINNSGGTRTLINNFVKQ